MNYKQSTWMYRWMLCKAFYWKMISSNHSHFMFSLLEPNWLYSCIIPETLGKPVASLLLHFFSIENSHRLWLTLRPLYPHLTWLLVSFHSQHIFPKKPVEPLFDSSSGAHRSRPRLRNLDGSVVWSVKSRGDETLMFRGNSWAAGPGSVGPALSRKPIIPLDRNKKAAGNQHFILKVSK